MKTAKQNMTATDVGMERENGDCDNVHTYRDMGELQMITKKGIVGRRTTKEKNSKNLATIGNLQWLPILWLLLW